MVYAAPLSICNSHQLTLAVGWQRYPTCIKRPERYINLIACYSEAIFMQGIKLYHLKKIIGLTLVPRLRQSAIQDMIGQGSYFKTVEIMFGLIAPPCWHLRFAHDHAISSEIEMLHKSEVRTMATGTEAPCHIRIPDYEQTEDPNAAGSTD